MGYDDPVERGNDAVKRIRANLILLIGCALLILGNALLLPQLLARAQALPVGEVVAQQAASAERLPLPELPEGCLDRPEPEFSRPLTEQEQAIWQEAVSYIMQKGNSYNYNLRAPITYTERAYERLKQAHIHGRHNPDVALWEMESQYRVGDGRRGSILIDLGKITMQLGDGELTKELALSFAADIYEHEYEYDPYNGDGEVAYHVWLMYLDYLWAQPNDHDPLLCVNRTLSPEEEARYATVISNYRFKGLRPAAQLPISEPAEDALWYDAENRMLHLPKRYQLTDDELMLHYELNESLMAQAVRAQGELIPEAAAIQKASEWAKAVLEMDVSELAVYAMLRDDNYFSGSEIVPVWWVIFGPEDMMLRGEDRFDGADVTLSALDGSFVSTYRYATVSENKVLDAQIIEQKESEWKRQAVELTERLFADGRKVKGVTYSGRGGDYAADAKAGDVLKEDMSYTTWVVSLEGGADVQIDIRSRDGAVVMARYWPDGCKDMG